MFLVLQLKHEINDYCILHSIVALKIKRLNNRLIVEPSA